MKKKILLGALAVGIFIATAYAAATKFTDLWVSSTLRVDGATTLNGALASNGRITATGGLVVPAVSGLLASTPTVAGMLANTTNYVLYVATATNSPAAWQKVGAQ